MAAGPRRHTFSSGKFVFPVVYGRYDVHVLLVTFASEYPSFTERDDTSLKHGLHLLW